MAISATDIALVISRGKILSGPMSWTKKLNRVDSGWVEFVSALYFADQPGMAPEGLQVRGQWQPPMECVPASWKFGLHFQGARIYAIDMQPLVRHKNGRAGSGRPLYGKVIDGPHEHTWSNDGEGYAEPIDLPELSGVESTWQIFAQRAGIAGNGFIHPDSATRLGQKDFFIL